MAAAKETKTAAAKKNSAEKKSSAGKKNSAGKNVSSKGTSKTAASEKKSSAAKTSRSSKNTKTDPKKSPRKNKKRSKITLILVLILVALIAALYFLRPDLFYSGKKIIFDYLGIQQTEQTAQNQRQDESENGKSGSESADKSVSENQKSDSESGLKSDGAKSAKSTSGTQKPLSAENLPLYFGNPSGATTEIKNAANYLMEKTQFSMSYNSEKLIPNWVMWHLDKDDMGEAERGDDFRPDAELPENFYGVKKADYQYTQFGFDRGHVCPSADRTSSAEDNSITFLMTNMIPQSPNCNRNVWKNLESYERELALNGKELYIAAGPFGKGGTSDKGTFEEIPLKNGQAIEVPSYCWKIIMILNEGENDFDRVDQETEILAAWIPNNQQVSEHTWDYYITTVDFIEEQTGHDFFAVLADEIEDTIEAKKYDYAK